MAVVAAAVLAAAATPPIRFLSPCPADDARVTRLKTESARIVDSLSKLTQEMVDQVFSFGELGFQEVETSKYLTGILEKNGFTITRNVAGHADRLGGALGLGQAGHRARLATSTASRRRRRSRASPTATRWSTARRGTARGTTRGKPLNVTAAHRGEEDHGSEKLPGTIVLWPGVAEEQMAGKAYFVRAGVFKDVDAVLFTHVSTNLGVSWGQSSQTALISAEFKFRGTSAHAAGAPWRGKSALDAVMLMAWAGSSTASTCGSRSARTTSSCDGGDQPNVVPQTATIWFYFRETRHSARDGDVRARRNASRAARR